MVVGVCGLGYTGSGAVFDLLKEYNDIQVQKGGEFWLSYRPDGIEDLVYHLNTPSRFTSSDVAILRFKKLVNRLFLHPSSWGLSDTESINQLTDNYIKSITHVQWKGFWTYDAISASKSERFVKWRLFRKLYDKFPAAIQSLASKYLDRDMYLSVCPENLELLTKKYISDLFKLLGYDDDKYLLVDQAFSGDNPQKSFPFFNNPKAIVVDKDPRDLYVLCKKELITDCRWVPTDNVCDFINYYRLIRKNIKQGPGVLYVKFEDLIFEYNKTVIIIEDFLGLRDDSHIDKLKFFNPSISKNNVQLYKRYPELKEDINNIEQSLSDYLFPFDKYPEVIHNGKSF